MGKQAHVNVSISTAEAMPTNASIRILIGDTDLSLFHFTRVVLAIIAVHQVDYAPTGEKVITLAKQFAPDLILLDDVPPAIDSMRVIQQLRADPSTTHIPIVAYMALANHTPRARAIIALCDGHLTKPCPVEDLCAVIQDCVPRYHPPPLLRRM